MGETIRRLCWCELVIVIVMVAVDWRLLTEYDDKPNTIIYCRNKCRTEPCTDDLGILGNVWGGAVLHTRFWIHGAWVRI